MVSKICSRVEVDVILVEQNVQLETKVVVHVQD